MMRQYFFVKNRFLLVCLYLIIIGGGETVFASDNVALSNKWETGSYIRVGYSSNDYANVLEKRESASIGGAFGIRSPEVNGFHFGATVYTAQPIGMNSESPEKKFVTLPAENLTILGKLYVQYTGYDWDIKAGRQDLNTPFANASDQQMIPLLYEGITASWDTSIKGLTFEGGRILRFKPFSGDFGKGDSGTKENPLKTSPGAQVESIDTSGFSMLGMKYKNEGLDAQAWYYHLNDRFNITYGELNYSFAEALNGQKIFYGLQYAHESSGNNVHPLYRHTSSDIYGGKLGFKNKYNTFFVAWANNPAAEGKFRGGGFSSPYQRAIYSGSPIFTSQPTMGFTTNEQPGYAWAIRNIIHFGQYNIALGYTQLDSKDTVDFYGNSLNSKHTNGRFIAFNYRPTKNQHLKLVLNHIHNGTAIPGSTDVVRLFYTYYL